MLPCLGNLSSQGVFVGSVRRSLHQRETQKTVTEVDIIPYILINKM
jgi:hypothetical protein